MGFPHAALNSDLFDLAWDSVLNLAGANKGFYMIKSNSNPKPD